MANSLEKDLHGYCTEANQLIEKGSLETAVAIGQHILQHYPKYVGAYRVLATATLEQGEAGYAADLFKRVLSADPEDLEARVGLGIIYTEEEALKEALWQWERAFELAPGNSDIRVQLRQVRERLEGSEFPRIELTRGALGRLYARGGLFQQAADEFRAVLRKDSEQVDIQVTLAETLWRDGKLAEAEAVCEQVLETLPNCLKANLILGHIWYHTGREEESHGPFRIAQSLDPENHVAATLLGEESPLTKKLIVIPQLDELLVAAPKPEDLISVMEEPALEEAGAEAELPDWLTQLRSTGIVEEEEEITEEESLPAWLTAIEPDQVGAPAAPVADIEPPPLEPEREPEGEELPDWLAELSMEEAEEPVTEPFTEVAVEEPLAVEALSPEPTAEVEEVPDWLAALKLEEAEKPPTEEGPIVEPLVEEPIAAEIAERDVPEWLAELRTEMEQDLTDIGEVDESISPLDKDADRFASRDIPGWLQATQEEGDLSAEAISEEDLLSSTIQPAEETPDWLAAVEGEEPATPEVETPIEPDVTETAEAAIPEEIPDWLSALKAEEPTTSEIEEPIEAAATEIAETAEPAEEIPDWLAVLQVEESTAPEVAAPPTEQETADTDLWREIMREEGLDEMIEAGPTETEDLPEEAEPAEEILDWLAALGVEEPAPPEVTEPEAAEAAEKAEEIPDWLAALQPEEPAAPEVTAPLTEPEAAEVAETAEPAEEIPDWLAALRVEEPAPPEVAEPPTAPEPADTELWREIMRDEGLEEMIEAVPVEAEDLPEEAEPIEEIPDWLTALQPEEPVAPQVAAPPAEPEATEAAEPAEEIPDWLAALQAEEPSAPEVAVPPTEPEAADTDLWREIMRQEGMEELTKVAPTEAEDLVEEAEPTEEIPDWLAALQPEEPTVPEVTVPPAEVAEAAEPVEETPDWLAALQADEPTTPEIAEPLTEPEEEDTDLWREIMRQEGLEDLTEVAPTEAEDLVEEAEPAEEIPDWLAALQADEPAASEVAAPPAEPEAAEVVEAAEPAKEIPDWLAALQTDEPATPEIAEPPTEPEEEDTDLWREIMRQEGIEEMIEVVPTEAEGLQEEAEPTEEAPDWLPALQAEEPAVPDVAVPPAKPEAAQIAEAAEPTEEIPDWLAALQTDEPATPEIAEPPTAPQATDEVPDWLVALQADEPAAPESAEGPVELEIADAAVETAEPVEPVEEEALVEEATLAGISVEAKIVDREAVVEGVEEAVEVPPEEAIPDWLAGWHGETDLRETAEIAVEVEVEEMPAAEVAVPEVTEKVKEEPVSFIVSSYLSRLETHPDDHEVRLALARAYRDEKKPASAFEQFQILVASGRLVNELLPDLEGLCTSYPGDAKWHQLLGDAYTRTNQLADALSAYRAAQNAILGR